MLRDSNNFPTAVIGGRQYSDGGFNVLVKAEELGLLSEDLSTTFTQRSKLLASDGQADDRFGHSLSVFENTLVIGAIGDDDKGSDSGSAYVFERRDGQWTQIQKLRASDGVATDLFGCAVAAGDGIIVIGAYGDDDKGNASGAAYIFELQDGTWVQTKKLVPSDGAGGDRYGYSVAIHNTIIAVGAYGDDDKGNASGSVYIIEKIDDVWTQTQKVIPSDGQAEDWFGWSVTLSHLALIIGAPGDDDRGSIAGSAYVFEKSDGLYVQRQKLHASDAQAGDWFGCSAAIYNSRMVIGAYGEDAKASAAGAAYIFERKEDTWVQVQKILPSDGAKEDYFGTAVSIGYRAIAIGSWADDDKGNASGSIYIYHRQNGTWVQTQKILPSDGAANDRIGYSMGISGDTVISGAYNHNAKGNDAGATYIFER